MAKYDVKFSCGHTERKELFGAEKERQSKIAYWEKDGVCSECYKKAQEQEAATFTQENALPALEGSEKQIVWAEKIRKTILEKSILSRNTKASKERAKTETSAKWFIDNRDLI